MNEFLRSNRGPMLAVSVDGSGGASGSSGVSQASPQDSLADQRNEDAFGAQLSKASKHEQVDSSLEKAAINNTTTW